MRADEHRASAFARWFDQRVGARSEPWRWGTVVIHEGLPSSRDVNFVRLEDPAAAEEPDAVVREVERAHGDAGLWHRRVVVDESPLAERLVPAFERAGWIAERYHLMVQRRAPLLRPDLPPAAEVTLPQFLRFRGLLVGAEDLAEVQVAADAVDRAIGTRCFLASVDRRPASGCVMWARDGEAQIDTVETLPSVRGRGAAWSVLIAATTSATASGAAWIHLYTRADVGPVGLYERLGFDVVGGVVDLRGPTGDP